MYPAPISSASLLQVINQVNFFYNAQKVGTLPAAVTNEVSWIQSSLSQEATAGPAGRDVSGGWVTGGDAFSTKATIPTAFTVSLMAWSLIRCGLGRSAYLRVHLPAMLLLELDVCTF